MYSPKSLNVLPIKAKKHQIAKLKQNIQNKKVLKQMEHTK